MTRYDLNHTQLEEVILFCVCVAGKNATTTAKCLEEFFWLMDEFWEVEHTPYHNPLKPVTQGDPFGYIDCFNEYLPPDSTYKVSDFNVLSALIRQAGLGCYNQRARSFVALAKSGLDLKTCTIEDLEKIPGIGPKTSRFFVLHTRRDVEVASLDTHILKYMRDRGYDVPKTTPTGKKYLKIEKEFLQLAKKSGKTMAQFDLDIWNKERKKKWKKNN